MKFLRLATVTASLLGLPASAQIQPPPGAVSPNQTFAVRSGSTFTASSLDAYAGKILVVMLMTPWCPFCQANTIAVGEGVLDHFNATTRGTLRGKNDQGIEIRSLLLSTEPASTWDSTNASFSTAQGFQQWGLDAAANRSNPRVLLGYYRGGFISGTNLYNWGEDRRRLVVLNLVNDSPTHRYREIVLNQNSFDSTDNSAARAAINAVRLAPVLLTYAQWAAARPLPVATSSAHHDPDGDRTPNLLEFFHGTDPLSPASTSPGLLLERPPSGAPRLTYQRAKNLSGLTVEHQTSTDLTTWTTLPAPPTTTTDQGTVDRIEITLPAPATPSTFYRLRITTQ